MMINYPLTATSAGDLVTVDDENAAIAAAVRMFLDTYRGELEHSPDYGVPVDFNGPAVTPDAWASSLEVGLERWCSAGYQVQFSVSVINQDRNRPGLSVSWYVGNKTGGLDVEYQ